MSEVNDWTVEGRKIHIGGEGNAWASIGSGLDDVAAFIVKRHNEALAMLRQHAEQAEADAAALRLAIRECQAEHEAPPSFRDSNLKQWSRDALFAAAAQASAGAALLAELAAYRSLANTLRAHLPTLARMDATAWQEIDAAITAVFAIVARRRAAQEGDGHDDL